MNRNLIERYIWLVDTLQQRGRMTRRAINDVWRLSRFSRDGEDMCRRTLYNYKNAIAQLFDIYIECDPVTFEYYIDKSRGSSSKFTEWLLNSSAVNDALARSGDISDRILLENVPSAREHLSTVFATLKSRTRLRFDYHNYSRSRPSRGVVIEPYLTRIFKQRWYVIGRNTADNRLKTYALDRMSNVNDTAQTFEMPEDFDAEEYFRYSFGIIVNESEPRDIVIRTDHRTAKFLAALPLHPSQQQTVHDNYCLFRYRMQITDDLVEQILSQGSRIVVEEPRELRVRIREELRRSLEAYDTNPIYSATTSSKYTLPVTDLDEFQNPKLQ